MQNVRDCTAVIITQFQEICMKKTIAIVGLLGGFACALPAQAQFAKPEDAIKYRKASLTLMAAHFGRIGAMAQGKVPFDAQVAADNAELVATLSRLPWAAFVEGSDVGDTKAKPEIWKQSAKFKEASDKFQQEAQKLLVAAKSGKEADVKAAFTATAGTCKGCHDDFRNK